MKASCSRALILFAKDPVEGQVKTRLSTLLDSATTLDLYQHFLRDSIEKLVAVEGVDCFVGIASEPTTDFFDQATRSRDIRLFIQAEGNLGERMRRAFEERFKEGYEQVAIIGADSPTLPLSYIEQALRSEKEVVIGPSTDGGYYLIGMKGGLTDIFDGVPWGTDRVLAETLKVLQDRQGQAELLPVWYDVDLPEDLRFLKTHLEWMVHSGLGENRATLDFLNQLFMKSKI
ncbi:MAG: TIGR04282 family arsenosugar biosynthesis glycosyltransferase [Nitrospinota bacterium]|nr:TIGR04282 family arsenosugar biosynthesis glycosyltransferase [Nitrospinota bacterium]